MSGEIFPIWHWWCEECGEGEGMQWRDAAESALDEHNRQEHSEDGVA